MSVTGQNIANVNTEGYSKRDVSLEELGGIQGGVTDVSDQTGLGVRVDEIRRSFNAYVNERLRNFIQIWTIKSIFKGSIRKYTVTYWRT